MFWMYLYRFLMMALTLPADYILKKRLAKGKEHPERLSERQGVASLARPDGDLVWFHVASVGEGVAILPLVKRLLAERQYIHVLVTSGSVTSAKILSERLPERAMHQFVPVDVPAWVDTFLETWKPTVAIFVESEIWPNLIHQTHNRGIPLGMVNGRVSAKSEKKWKYCYGFIRYLSSLFSVVIPASKNDMARLQRLGFDVSHAIGNIKLYAEPLSYQSDVVQYFETVMAERPVWVASCLHPEDDTIALNTHQSVLAEHADGVVILVPRHPERADAIETLCIAKGWHCVRLYQGETLAPVDDLKGAQVVLVDVIGRMGDVYELSDVVYLGGGFSTRGGHNPMEPLRQGCVVIQGGDTSNCRDAVEILFENDLGVRAKNTKQVTQAIIHALGDRAYVQSQKQRAEKMCASLSHVLDNTIGGILPIIDKATQPFNRDNSHQGE